MNKQLLEHYIEAYGTDIYSFCIRLTQNRELAEELYQDTFLAMCEKEDWNYHKARAEPETEICLAKEDCSGDSLIEGAGTGSIFGR